MPPQTPRVSIGVPVYNGERFLRCTVESLLAQTFTDFELLISDNASTDATEQIARSLAARDRRVVLYRQERNIGLAGNYNFLLERARGRYFKWATCDDPCEPRFLELCVEALDRDPGVVLAYPRARFIDQDGATLEVSDPGFALDSPAAADRLRYVIGAGHWVNAILGVIRRDALLQAGGLPAYAGGDYVLLGELCVRGRFTEIPSVQLLRRLHPAASSQISRDSARITRYLAGRDIVSMPGWSRLRDHARTILRADLGLVDKLSLLWTTFRKAHAIRFQLREEIVRAGRAILPTGRRSVAR